MGRFGRSGDPALESLFRIIGADEARIEWARGVLGRRLRDEFEALVDRAAHATMTLPGYELLHVDQVRPNTRRGMQAVLATLEGADWGMLGALMEDVAYVRAGQGLDPRALFMLMDQTEDQLGEIASRCLHGADELILAAIVARRICGGGRRVVIEAFQRAHREARDAAQTLARQFSAPILPALPGVLVLPIVGAMPATRAREVVDALLAGIASHAAHAAIVDITGLTAADASLSMHLRRVAAGARLLGARLVLAGVSPAVAAILTGDGEGLRGVQCHATLADALAASATRGR